MLTLIFILLATTFGEALLHAVLPKYELMRKSLAVVSALSIIIGTGVIVWLRGLDLLIAVLLFISAYRIWNLARIVKGRMHAGYIWRVTFRTSIWLLVTQFLICLAYAVWIRAAATTHLHILTLVMVAQMLLSGLFVQMIRGHARRMRKAITLTAVHDTDLPSVTVAIPARNETDELHDCITALLASHYPKLEILVLDDCSQLRRTPEIIKSFAHDGVRFIQGTEPKDTWLAKNQAYDTLADAASGEYILFAGVDIRFSPTSLRQIVGYAQSKDKTMLCVMPQNIEQAGSIPLIQPMRYVWELAFPRKFIHKPPVLSSCWLISKKALQQSGGFEAASRMVVPEAYFARREAEHDGYSFVASGDTFGVSSVKSIATQRDTAIRVAYPQTHRRPEIVALNTLGYLIWTLAPLYACVLWLLGDIHILLLALVVMIVAANSWGYAMVYRLAYGKAPMLSIASLPLAALVYIGLLNYSMYKYEFSEVLWKGRNVCLPVMHVIPKLPEV